MFRFIISIIGFSVAIGVFFFYTKPTYDSVKKIQAEIATYDQALERVNELQTRKQELLSRYNAFNPADIDKLQKLLPDHVDNVRLILDFDNLASTHRLAIQNVVVGRSGGDTSSAGQAQPAEIIGGGSKPYDSLTLKFSTRGTYESFGKFMEDVQTSLRVVDLVSLTLSQSSGGTSDEEPQYDFDVTIRTYWLKK